MCFVSFWVFFAYFGCFWSILGAFWAVLGAFLGSFSAVWPILGAFWVILGDFDLFWAILFVCGCLGVICGFGIGVCVLFELFVCYFNVLGDLAFVCYFVWGWYNTGNCVLYFVFFVCFVVYCFGLFWIL